jgi:hypothetical protein
VTQFLVSTLLPDDIVVMDKLGSVPFLSQPSIASPAFFTELTRKIIRAHEISATHASPTRICLRCRKPSEDDASRISNLESAGRTRLPSTEADDPPKGDVSLFKFCKLPADCHSVR